MSVFTLYNAVTDSVSGLADGGSAYPPTGGAVGSPSGTAAGLLCVILPVVAAGYFSGSAGAVVCIPGAAAGLPGTVASLLGADEGLHGAAVGLLGAAAGLLVQLLVFLVLLQVSLVQLIVFLVQLLASLVQLHKCKMYNDSMSQSHNLQDLEKILKQNLA